MLLEFPVDIFLSKGRQTYEKYCIKFSNHKFSKISFFKFLTQNNL